MALRIIQPGADGAALIKRFGQVKSRRQVVEEAWRDGYRYTFPLRGSGFETMGEVSGNPTQQNASVARDRQAELLDSTGTDSARILGSGLVSGLVPSNSRWLGLETDDETEEEKVFLGEGADKLWKKIHATNFDGVIPECMQDMTVAGMFALLCDEDLREGGFRFEAWALSNCYFAASIPGGPIDTVFYEFPLSAEQAVNEYGRERVSEKLRKLVDDGKPDEMVTFVRCIYPRPGPHGRFALNLPFASVHIEKDLKHVVRESGYHEMPVGVPRWNTIPGSVYAFGPVQDALPDLKTLNKEVGYVLANADLATAGMWGAVDDGVLNPRTVKVGPRKVIVMAAKDNFFALQPAGKFDVAGMEIERIQRSIRKVLMADQLEPQLKAGTPPTATEILVRVELIRQLLGPVYGRMSSEFLQWLVKRTFGIAYRAGALGKAPESLMQPGRLVSVTYLSPIARAQKATDVAAMDRYEASLLNRAAALANANQPFEHILDNYDWDAADRLRAELLGVPAKLMPDSDGVKAKRDQRQKAQKQAQAQDALTEVAVEQAKKAA